MLLTGCPTGIAHTYMAAEALEKKAQELGYPIKVETRGSGGSGMLYGHGGYYGWRYGSTGGNCRGLQGVPEEVYESRAGICSDRYYAWIY